MNLRKKIKEGNYKVGKAPMTMKQLEELFTSWLQFSDSPSERKRAKEEYDSFTIKNPKK